jgi:uncharacterized delta-60 repeat protein
MATLKVTLYLKGVLMRHLIDRLEPRRLFDAGQIDTTFGTSGHTDLPAPTTQFDTLAVDIDSTPNGQIVVTAQTTPPTDVNELGTVLIWRLRPDGSKDTSFGPNHDGLAQLPGGDANSAATIHTVLTPDSGLLVQVGRRVYKLKQNGTRDNAFGGKGKIDLGGQTNYELAADPAGRFYVPGADAAGGLIVRRFNSDGSLDVSYGVGGTFNPPGDIEPTNFHSLLLPTGDILIAGAAKGTHEQTDVSFPGFDLDAIRLKPDGSLDTAYGDNGVARDQIPATDLYTVAPFSPTITADGSVFVTEQQREDLSSGNTIDSLDPTGQPAGAQVDDAIREAGFSDVFRDDSVFATITEQKVRYPNVVLEAPIPAQFVPVQLGVQTDGSVLVLSNVTTSDDATTLRTVSVHRLYRDDAPLAQMTAKTLTRERNASYRFTVQYRDDDGIDLSTLGNNDITVQLPGGGRRNARLLGTDVQTNAKVVNATYLITSPDGIWGASDNGEYAVRIERRSVRDINGNSAAQRPIGTFAVQIPNAAAPAMTMLPASIVQSTPRKRSEPLEIEVVA